MQAALNTLWPYVDELFSPADDPVRAEFDTVMASVLPTATLALPDVEPMGRVAGRAGREGVHTAVLSYVLAEMQSVARAYPGATW
jgi:ring-1,2-phenylacetyl-CoA epoxidase subunit PaaC